MNEINAQIKIIIRISRHTNDQAKNINRIILTPTIQRLLSAELNRGGGTQSYARHG